MIRIKDINSDLEKKLIWIWMDLDQQTIDVRMKYRFLDVYSDKNSLAII